MFSAFSSEIGLTFAYKLVSDFGLGLKLETSVSAKDRLTSDRV